MHYRIAIAATMLALAGGLGACRQADDDDGDAAGNPESEVTLEEVTGPIEDVPPELASVRDEANELLDGGVEAFGERLASLQGTPVVVNKWASWCGPCRFEFPFFQSQAIKRGDEVAFLGIDSDDSEDAAATFLEELPLPYPSYLDPGQELAGEFLDGAREFPATGFYDSSGELAYVHLGGYPDEATLASDIKKYAR